MGPAMAAGVAPKARWGKVDHHAVNCLWLVCKVERSTPGWFSAESFCLAVDTGWEQLDVTRRNDTNRQETVPKKIRVPSRKQQRGPRERQCEPACPA